VIRYETSFRFVTLRCVCVAGMLVVLSGMPSAQVQSASDEAAVTFTFDFPGSDPDHYVITVKFDGQASYVSTGKLSQDAEGGQNFQKEFSVTEATRIRIFDLAKRAHYFQGDLDSRKKNLASTGVKILAYTDSHGTRQGTYNYSMIPAVQDLTQVFQGISATMEYAHRLDYYHRYQKLALDEETKRLEQNAKDSNLMEIQALKPVLQQIADDNTVINVVRARVQRIMMKDGAGAAH
jgi:hypothetical protein